MKKALCYAASVALASSAWADTISPSSFADTIAVGESTTVTKTITVTPELTTATVDVFFLMDTTGSMGSAIGQAVAAASSIFTNTNALGNVQYGVGHYEDYPVSPYGDPGNTPWELVQDLTADTTLVNNALGSLFANGGNDGPESAFDGLTGATDDTSWRPGSKRILFWFADAPSHDEPAHPGPTQAATIASLNGENIEVNAISYGSYFDSAGQATAVTAATGGALFPSGDTDALIQIVKDALDASFDTYSTVSLDISEVPGGLVAISSPGSYFGDFTRDAEETFEFELIFTGVTPGTYDFDVYGLVDGVRTTLAESDRIIVTGDGIIPEPSMGIFGGMALLLGFLGLRRRRS